MTKSETMTRDELYTRMKEILIADFELEAEAITPDALLYTDLDLDSIDAVDLIVKMKEYVPGKIEPEIFKNAKTINDITDALYSLVSAEA